MFDAYSQVSELAMDIGELYSAYTPLGYSGAYYDTRIGHACADSSARHR